MEKTKCALLDTDFISKLHITRKDDENRLIERILELQDYQFVCHEQITIELGRHNASAKDWLKSGLTYGGGIPSISALSAFYVLKERLARDGDLLLRVR